MSGKGKQLQSGDFLIVMLTVALVIFGIIMVFSASYYWSISKTGNPYNFLIKDIIFAAIGFGIMLFTMIFDYHKYKKWGNVIMVAGILLLILVLLVGDNINGATRWIAVGPFTIMPGEIAKICIIIFTAKFLSTGRNRVNSLVTGIFPLLIMAGILGGLIMLQPNMSTAIIVVGIIIAMMFVAGLENKYMIGVVGLGVVASLALIFMKSGDGDYRQDRVASFIDPFKDALGEGFQVVQGLLALGSGGLTGMGLGKSVQKNLYLPEPQNDFILSIIGEELGYVAIIILMFAYLFLVWRGIQIAMRAKDKFGMLLASGITIMIAAQVILNVAVVTSSMPPTGVTLPFISYGGNALWLFMGAVGILINISRQSPKEESQESK